jgi:hypothetical protein
MNEINFFLLSRGNWNTSKVDVEWYPIPRLDQGCQVFVVTFTKTSENTQYKYKILLQIGHEI